MMQRIKEFLSDLSGTIVATGTPSAIVLSTASPISAYVNGFVMRFSAVATNTGKTTININGMGEKPVFKRAGAKTCSSQVCAYKNDDDIWVTLISNRLGFERGI